MTTDLVAPADSSIDRFMAHHATYNGVKAKRVATMGRVLRAIAAYAGCEPHEITPQQFQDWMASRLADGLKGSSVAVEGTMACVYFRWCWRQGLMDSDLLLRLVDVPKPAGTPPDPRPYDRRELTAFWRDLDLTYPQATELKWRRWRNGTSPWRSVWRESMRLQLEAITSLALDCGLRKSEIHVISIDDIHPDNDFVVVRKGKGKGEGAYREVPMIDSTRVAVHTWLDLREEIGPSHDRPWLILDPRATCFAGPLDWPGEKSFGRFMARIGRGWEFHRFRHTCATEWLRAGMPLEEVSRLMGHSSLQMTLRYAKLVNTDIHRSATRFSEKFSRAVRPEAIHTGNEQEVTG